MAVLRIASRKSELAQMQARAVGAALTAKIQNLKIEFTFKETSGDQDLSTPLWQMGGRGVFTDDFYRDLLADQCDLVVHSWKDLPIEARDGTAIVGVLEREDARDVLLLPKKLKANWSEIRKLNILTSSPRRRHNLASFLFEHLPQNSKSPLELNFCDVRGNVPTRLKKMLAEASPAGVIIAKAAIDRLASVNVDFAAEITNQCAFMVLPVAVNPPAPAQGCLAVEYLRQRNDIAQQIDLIRSPQATNVEQERKFLASYGGGCHQKIGAYKTEFNGGHLFVARGQSDSGERINRLDWSCDNPPPRAAGINFIFPANDDAAFFERESRKSLVVPSGFDLIVSRGNAWPKGFTPTDNQIVWCSGLKTWKRLASLGIWVHGSFESLGEKSGVRIKSLIGREPNFLKMTHQDSVESDYPVLPTYQLLLKAKGTPDLSGKTHFFWMSGSTLRAALAKYPDLLKAGHHSSGLGSTFDLLNMEIPDKARASAFLSRSQWMNFVLNRSNESKS